MTKGKLFGECIYVFGDIPVYVDNRMKGIDAKCQPSSGLILVSPLSSSLPKHLFEALIAHEIGHIVNYHEDKYLFDSLPNIFLEMYADNFACHMCSARDVLESFMISTESYSEPLEQNEKQQIVEIVSNLEERIKEEDLRKGE